MEVDTLGKLVVWGDMDIALTWKEKKNNYLNVINKSQ